MSPPEQARSRTSREVTEALMGRNPGDHAARILQDFARLAARSPTMEDVRAIAAELQGVVDELRGIGAPTMVASHGAWMQRPDTAEPELQQAIRVFTVDAPNDQPNGPAEKEVLALGRALERRQFDEVRGAYRRMCSAMADNTRALRVAAEAFFGGDFGSPPADG